MADASSMVFFRTKLLPPFPRFSKAQTHNLTSIWKVRRDHRSLTTIHCSSSVSTVNVEPKSPGQKGGVSWGCDVDSLENAASLQKWLNSSGLPEQKMALQSVDVGERGLVALQSIRKGEKLLFVPPSLVISANSEWSCKEAGEILKQYNVPDWPLLATYLISEANLNSSSRWENYISALPRQPYSLLYCCCVSFQDSVRTR